MKKFRLLIVSIIAIAVCAVSTSFAEQTPNTKYANPEGNVSPNPKKIVCIENGIDDKKVHTNKTQAINYVIIDSLANAYSYISQMANKAFQYDINTGTLMTVKRGAHDVKKAKWQFYDGVNTLYNIFARTSTDMGHNWDEAIPLYIKEDENIADARYPSAYGFEFEGEYALAYTFPIVDFDAGIDPPPWYGFLTGMYTSADNSRHTSDNFDEIDADGTDVYWSTTSRILAGVKKGTADEYYIVAAGRVSLDEDDKNNTAEASNIGIRRTTDLYKDNWIQEIPAAWRSTKFQDPVDVDFIANELVALKKDANDEMYLAVHGNFLPEAGEPTDRLDRLGVSMSDDYGATWSDFETCPYEVIDAFAVSQGYPATNGASTSWNTKDFVVLDNGDYSFIAIIYLGEDLSMAGGVEEIRIVEVYRESGEWGIRNIAEVPNSYYPYLDMFNTAGDTYNPSMYEINAARTVDGSAIIAKWVAATGYDEVNDNYTRNDVIVCHRLTNSDSWNEPINVTDDENIDRMTFIPDYVSNDLKDIPILSCYGIIEAIPETGEMMTELSAQLYTLNDQYVRMGHFDILVGIEDAPQELNTLSVGNVFPNPAAKYTNIEFKTSSDMANVSVEIFNMLGEKVQTVWDGNLFSGSHTMPINVTDLACGTYYCSIVSGADKVSRMITVVR